MMIFYDSDDDDNDDDDDDIDHRHQIEGGHQLSRPCLHPRAFTPRSTISTRVLQCKI